MEEIIKKYENNKKIKNIIHLSDIHIRLNKNNSRYDEYIKVFNNLINNLSNYNNLHETIILITGDIFHDKNIIDSNGIALFNNLMAGLTKLTSVYLIMGNHDYRQEFDNDEIDILSALINDTNIPNLYYLKKTGLYLIGTDILFGLMAINDILTSGSTSGRIENLPEFPSPEKYKNIKYKIAIFHGMPDFIKNQNLPITWFRNYDFALLGDIHEQNIYNAKYDNENNIYDFSKKNKLIWGYPGSLIQQSFGETIDKHGYLFWDFENNIVKPIDIINEYILCNIKYKNNDWNTLYKNNILKFEDFINDNNFIKNINLRLSTKYKNYDLSNIISILNEKNIKFNLNHILQNDENLLENNESNDLIISYNSSDNYIKYISENINSNDTVFEKYNWKDIIKEPYNLLITDSFILDKIFKVCEKRNKKIETCIQKYNDSIDNSNIVNSTFKIKYISFDWILCFKNNCYINFENMNKNIVLINAPNGYGKTSLLEIISYGIFGEGFPSRKNKSFSSSVICNQKNQLNKKGNSNIKIIFEINNEKYVIERVFRYQKDVNKLNKAINKLYRFNVNDNKINLVLEKSDKAVDNWIKDNIGTIDSFLTSSIITQNSDKDFFSMDSKEQKKLLEQSLSLDSITKFDDLLKESNLAYNDIIENLNSIYTNSIKEIKDIKEDEINTLKNDVEKSNHDYNDLQDKLSNINNEISKVIQDDLNENDINKDDDSINNEIKILESKIEKDFEKNINILHQKKGKLLNKIETFLSIFNDLNINKDFIVDGNWFNSCNNIFGYSWSCYSREDSERYNNENVRNININELKKEYKLIKKYFQNIEKSEYDINNLNIKLKECNENIIKYSDNISELNSKIEHLYDLNETKNQKINKLSSKQNKLEKIELTIEKCNKNITKFEKMNNKFDNKKLSLDEDNKKLNEYNLLYDKYIKFCDKELELNSEINEIKNTEYPYNPKCECCQKQPWKLHLNNLESNLESILNDKNNVIISLKKYNSNIEKSKEFINDITKNINKINKWIEDYDYHKNNINYWKEQIILIEKNNKIINDINKITQLIENDKILLTEYKDNKKKLSILLKEETKTKTNYEEKIQQISKLVEWENKRDKNHDNILWYCWYSNKICNEYIQVKSEFTDITDKINIYNNNIKYNNKIDYWNNILKIKPIWKESISLKIQIKKKFKYLQVINSKYVELNKLFNFNKNKKKENEKLYNYIENLSLKNEIVEKLKNYFINYKEWLYKTKILPNIISNVNNITNILSKDNRIINLDYTLDKNTINWKMIDGKNTIIINNASGYQRFLLGLAVRITLSNINISKIKCKQLFIDEGFTSCDEENLNKMTSFISSLTNLYDSIVIVSHLKKIKDCAKIQIDINRNEKDSLSYINYGIKYKIESNKITTDNN